VAWDQPGAWESQDLRCSRSGLSYALYWFVCLLRSRGGVERRRHERILDRAVELFILFRDLSLMPLLRRVVGRDAGPCSGRSRQHGRPTLFTGPGVPGTSDILPSGSFFSVGPKTTPLLRSSPSGLGGGTLVWTSARLRAAAVYARCSPF